MHQRQFSIILINHFDERFLKHRIGELQYFLYKLNYLLRIYLMNAFSIHFSYHFIYFSYAYVLF